MVREQTAFGNGRPSTSSRERVGATHTLTLSLARERVSREEF
jgi:hypothetical protein